MKIEVIKKINRSDKFIKKKTASNLTIYIPLPTKTTEVFDSYWRFAAIRQDVFFNRLEGKPYPWSEDPIINHYKFTNVYRAADRVSQYLIKNVIYNPRLPNSPKEVLFRILLFKLFNKIETWELISLEIGDIIYEEYNFEKYNRILSEGIASGTIYSAAYIMASGKIIFWTFKKAFKSFKIN